MLSRRLRSLPLSYDGGVFSQGTLSSAACPLSSWVGVTVKAYREDKLMFGASCAEVMDSQGDAGALRVFQASGTPPKNNSVTSNCKNNI